jgi:hypothetical protein
MTINEPDVTVRLDDRVRLMAALLAATQWPDQSQEKRPHGTHAHARATRKHVSPFKTHEAVQSLQGLLDQGAPLEAIFTLALLFRWPELELDPLPRWVPPRWPQQLRDFYQKADLARWWEGENFAWQKSVNESTKMFKDRSFKPFLKPFLGDIPERLIFIPHIAYPTDQEIGVKLPGELVCIAPPRLAWGDSPPWPFDEDASHIYRAALSTYGRILMANFLRINADQVAEAAQTPLPVGDQFQAMYPTWQEQFTNLIVSGMVAIYLEDHVNKAEANAYVLMERKVQGVALLPGVISVLRRYLNELETGHYKSLLDFLPVFPKQLRVAKRIVTL